MSDDNDARRLGGRKERNSRLSGESKGKYLASSHVDFLILVQKLYISSCEYAQKQGGNVSPYSIAGIPLLISMLRALVIDCEVLSCKRERDFACLQANDDLKAILDRFGIRGDLRENASYLLEIRNEIIHPTHVAIVERDHWPKYLRFVKDKGLLNSSGHENADYDFFHQMHSHRLFEWAIGVTIPVAREIFFSYQEEPGWSSLENLWKNFDQIQS